MSYREPSPSPITNAVVESFEQTPDPRTRQILTAVTRHLHALVTELSLTQDEWQQAIDYLTEVGSWCDATRQEFILLSDVLGVSSLVETVNSTSDGTSATVLGPFHMTESPTRALGASISAVQPATAVVTGIVVDARGRAIPATTIDVWQCDEHGFYDIQQPDTQPAGNGRGLFTADEDGRFWFRTVVPSHYPIPTDGPVGRLLDAASRHPYRPAHVHFIAGSPGYRTLTTHAFVAGSPYLDSDAVFAVKDELVVEFAESTDARQAAAWHVQVPFQHAHFEIRLVRDDE